VRSYFLFYLLSYLTGNPITAIIILLVIYFFIDKAYVGILPDIFAPFKRNKRIRSLLTELAINPANSYNAIELGVHYYEKRQYKKALEYLNKAYERVKDSEKLYLYSGLSYSELGEHEQAREAFEKGLAINQGLGYGLPYVYLLQHEMDKYDKDESEIKRLEDRFWKYANTENLYKMGMVYKKKGKKQKAREMFDSTLKEYSYCPKNLRKLHRRWALLSRINKLTV
jgi:tetratricopeptide (TPR) repeat protein